MPDTADKKRYRFSGHQTFAFRYGWIEKGVRAVDQKASALADEDALVRLGVGKNMVESIRYWCQVAQMVEETPGARKPGGRELQPTSIGRRLILEPGWDPFLEDDASLWLIHWLIVSNPTIVTTWQIVFAGFHRPDASKREVVDFVAGFAAKHGAKVNDSSLTRDVDCFLRTYSPMTSGAKQGPVEESFDCPLQELSLLQPSPDGEFYRFAIGTKPTLPTGVFGFALLQYFQRTRGSRATMTVQDCLYGTGSPGQAFRLDENAVVEYVEELNKTTGGKVCLSEGAGLKQILRDSSLDELSLLDRYYGAEAGR